MSTAGDESFRWEDLDQRLLSPKTNDLAEEMSERSAKAESEIAFETAQSGNSAGYLPRLFDFHEQLTNEWAERLYAVHSEVLRQQNRSASAAFIRAVRDRPIAEMIAARKSSLQSWVCLRATRIGEQPNSAALAEWNRRMDRLATRWNRKLEAEAVAIEYRVSTGHSPAQVLSPPSTNNAPKFLEGDRDQKTREAVIRKVQNPQAHTILSIPEAALYFEVQPRTIHRWMSGGKLKSGARRGSITIESILKWQKKRSRKRRAS